MNENYPNLKQIFIYLSEPPPPIKCKQKNIKIITKTKIVVVVDNFESLELQNFNVTYILKENRYKPERLFTK